LIQGKLNVKMIIICFGLIGSGKSYLASRLANKIKAEYLSSDRIRMKLFPNRSYSDSEKKKVYRALLANMILLIENGHDVVIDATFFKNELRDKFKKQGDFLNQKVHFIELTASDEIIKSRTTSKRKDSEADYEVHLKIKGDFEIMEEAHLILDSGKLDEDEMINLSLNYIHYAS